MHEKAILKFIRKVTLKRRFDPFQRGYYFTSRTMPDSGGPYIAQVSGLRTDAWKGDSEVYSKSDVPMESDIEGLIKTEPVVEPQTGFSLSFFLILQFAQLIWYLVGLLFDVIPSTLLGLGHIVIALTNLFACQSTLGRVLVGLSWAFSTSESGFYTFAIEPDPFVPTKLNSNCFWVGLSVSLILSLVISVRALVLRGRIGFFTICTSIFTTATYLLTIVVFFKIQQRASKASVDAVRTVLLGNTQPFPEAEDVSESSGNAEPEKVKEVQVEEEDQKVPSEEGEVKIEEIV